MSAINVADITQLIQGVTNADSGYFDILHLNTRIQWGVYTKNTAAIQTFSLPAPFANSTYLITAGSYYNPGGAPTQRRFRPRNASQFDVLFGYSFIYPGNTANQPFGFFAIGLMP